jgi:hypothetical protein
MQILKRSELPEELKQELDGSRFCILSAGRWPKVLAKGMCSVDLGIEHKGISRTRDGYHHHTGEKITVHKTGAELSEEIGNVDHPDCQMYRIDD